MNKETGRNRAEETEERQEKSKDIKERVSVSERRWKKYMAGWPTFLSVSGWINRDKLRLPAGYKLVTFARVVFL